MPAAGPRVNRCRDRSTCAQDAQALIESRNGYVFLRTGQRVHQPTYPTCQSLGCIPVCLAPACRPVDNPPSPCRVDVGESNTAMCGACRPAASPSKTGPVFVCGGLNIYNYILIRIVCRIETLSVDTTSLTRGRRRTILKLQYLHTHVHALKTRFIPLTVTFESPERDSRSGRLMLLRVTKDRYGKMWREPRAERSVLCQNT